MNRIKMVLLALATTASMSLGTESEPIVWQSFTIKSNVLWPVGEVTVEATSNASSISKLSIEAYGRKTVLDEAELKKLEGFPLSSCELYRETGYPAHGDDMVHMKLSRPYYDKETKPTLMQKEEIIISVQRTGAATITKRIRP